MSSIHCYLTKRRLKLSIIRIWKIKSIEHFYSIIWLNFHILLFKSKLESVFFFFFWLSIFEVSFIEESNNWMKIFDFSEKLKYFYQWIKNYWTNRYSKHIRSDVIYRDVIYRDVIYIVERYIDVLFQTLDALLNPFYYSFCYLKNEYKTRIRYLLMKCWNQNRFQRSNVWNKTKRYRLLFTFF